MEQVFLNQPPADRAMNCETHFDTEVALRIAGGSPAVGVIDSVPTVKELIDTTIREAEQILSEKGSLGKLLG